jgi:hypothetical protein
VTIGVIEKNPSSVSGMIEISEELQQYLPLTEDGEKKITTCHGDGLTVERLNDAHKARIQSTTPEESFSSIQGAPQEMHKEMVNLQVH